MGVYSRPDSPYWWLWLEFAPPGQQKEKTAIRIGTTTADRIDSRRQAEQVYAKRVLEHGARVHRLPFARPAMTFADYADLYERDILPHNRGQVRELEILKVLRAAFGRTALQALDRERIQEWITARRAAVSASTVNREVDLLKSMLRDAAPKYIEASPIAGMKRLRTVTPRRRVLQPDEERRLLKACTEPQEKALLILGLDTLQRLGDLLDLQREDRQGDWIYIRDTKNGDALEVPLSPRAAKALDKIPDTGPYYFSRFRTAENPRDWRSSVRQRLEKLCAAADVPFGRAKGGITFHWATRRTGATRLVVKKNTPIAVVQRIGGWKKPDVLLEIYTEAQRADLSAAVGQRRKRRKSA